MALKHPPVDIIGWVGVLLIVTAYGLNTVGAIARDDLLYLFANLAGAGALCYSSYHKRDWQPVVLNLIWILIAIIGLALTF